MCGMVCGMVCGLKPLLRLTVRHVWHLPYMRACGQARALRVRAYMCAPIRTCRTCRTPAPLRHFVPHTMAHTMPHITHARALFFSRRRSKEG